MSTSNIDNNNSNLNEVDNNSQPNFGAQNSSDVSSINDRLALGNNAPTKESSEDSTPSENSSSLPEKDGLDSDNKAMDEEFAKKEQEKAAERADKIDTAKTIVDPNRTAGEKAKALAAKKAKKLLKKIPLKYKLIIGGVAVGFFLLVMVFIGIIAYVADRHPFLAKITGLDFDGFDTNISLDLNSSSSYYSTGNSGSYTGCSYNVAGTIISNDKIKVRLLNDSGTPINNELIDFDKYVLGVGYGENDQTEGGFKAEVVAARSYALMRGKNMNGTHGVKMTQENGYYIINIRNSTNDQLYCDPDTGKCGMGIDKGKGVSDKLRQWASEVAGEVVVDSSGKVVSTPYLNNFQGNCRMGICMSHTEANNMSKQGKNYKDILMKMYSEISSTVSRECKQVVGSASSNKEAENWKQFQGGWENKIIESQTIAAIGCALTSVSIQIARSGVKTTVSGEFNPGTFMETHKANGGFVGDSGDELVWDVTDVAPNFKLISAFDYFNGTKEEKASAISKKLANGEYVVLGVRKSQGAKVGHYVAVNYATEDAIYIFDPGKANNDDVFKSYPNMTNSSEDFQVISYKVGG